VLFISGTSCFLGSLTWASACLSYYGVPSFSIDRLLTGQFVLYRKLAQQFIKLTTEEAAAINCHMGFSDGSATTVRDVSNAYQQFPLAWILFQIWNNIHYPRKTIIREESRNAA
ncbi:MAG: hypothetical protein IJ231_05305, partial [Clostridia bacterium]|nr:hypothetical protein [Clostridia bacterium]